MVKFNISGAEVQFSFIKDYLRSMYPTLDAYVCVRGIGRTDGCTITITGRADNTGESIYNRQVADSAIRVLKGTYSYATFINAC